jgi:hypothetical protein
MRVEQGKHCDLDPSSNYRIVTVCRGNRFVFDDSIDEVNPFSLEGVVLAVSGFLTAEDINETIDFPEEGLLRKKDLLSLLDLNRTDNSVSSTLNKEKQSFDPLSLSFIPTADSGCDLYSPLAGSSSIDSMVSVQLEFTHISQALDVMLALDGNVIGGETIMAHLVPYARKGERSDDALCGGGRPDEVDIAAPLANPIEHETSNEIAEMQSGSSLDIQHQGVATPKLPKHSTHTLPIPVSLVQHAIAHHI